MKYLVLIVVALLVACTQTQQPIVIQNEPVPSQQPIEQPAPEQPIAEPEQTAPEQSSPEQTPPEELAPSQEQRFSIDASEWDWTPATLTVKAGQPVTLTITNAGERDHGLAIPEFNVNKYVAAGDTQTVTFTPDKPGTYRYFCNVPCGSGHSNMRGTLIVE